MYNVYNNVIRKVQPLRELIKFVSTYIRNVIHNDGDSVVVEGVSIYKFSYLEGY